MKNIKILGGGCSNCNKLEILTKEVLDENSIPFEINHIKDLSEIMSYGVMKTPALIVDEKVIISGRVPSKKELIKRLIE
ncbi:MAG: hypothetical protein PWP28_1393 [Oceanotoga sp.]|uniref:Small redox-active disulfide protein 2 n=1 Tax=Oceanotoga teriensis TaxID=515440 RepID=A0AA45C7Z1_9BACT|nr:MULTISPECIES: thioredoxin family protein [Oceanotoga]MDN5342518.1 hypothetical protein [Oceanotoga sp.]PWJ95653.1 small redox-active disulfide protein 2 [Oceanotoga teriensis]